MDRGWMTYLRRFTRRIWGRLVLISVSAVLFVLAASHLGQYAPELADVDLGQDSVTTILSVLASSMLAVTTFSLTALISAYSSASRSATPRATRLLVEDPTSQNALAAFLGAFVYSIAGIVALASGTVAPQAKVLLFLGTLAVIAAVVITLVRWIEHLTRFGRMADILDRVEDAAADTLRTHAQRPHLGGEAPQAAEEAVVAVRAESTGFVTVIAMDRLTEIASREDARIHVDLLPGDDARHGDVLARVEGATSEKARDDVRGAFLIERHRTYEQDPRLGLVALAEIASRALSPSTNDQGTAIEVLGALERVLGETMRASPDRTVTHPGVHVPAVQLTDLLADAFRPVARDGAAVIEVAVRLQRVLAGLAAAAQPVDREAVIAVAEECRRRAVAGLDDAQDRDAVNEAHTAVLAAGGR